MSHRYPYTIDNGPGGERITFRGVVPGGRLEVDAECAPGAGPAMHVHYKQVESLTVTSGRMGVEVLGAPAREIGPGETVQFEAGVPHRFWNVGPERLTLTGWIQPANNLEYFLTALYRSQKSGDGKRPDSFDGAWLLTHFASEFGMPGIPAFVRKVIFPLTVFVGRLAGKHRRFADAPEPIR
jgi:mannose-6-phosphate isomerase-like protein (cupin superfamily)